MLEVAAVHGLGTIAGVEQVHSSTLHGMHSSVDGMQCNLEGFAGPDKVQIVELQGFCDKKYTLLRRNFSHGAPKAMWLNLPASSMNSLALKEC